MGVFFRDAVTKPQTGRRKQQTHILSQSPLLRLSRFPLEDVPPASLPALYDHHRLCSWAGRFPAPVFIPAAMWLHFPLYLLVLSLCFALRWGLDVYVAQAGHGLEVLCTNFTNARVIGLYASPCPPSPLVQRTTHKLH